MRRWLDRLRVNVIKKLRSRGGMTLIELIVGLAISSVVSIMAAQFFSVAVRLHRTSTEISSIQKDAQTMASMIERAVMSAEDIYFYDNGNENYMLIGRESGAGAAVMFTGQVFYYNRREKKFYADTDFAENSSKETLFNTMRARSETGLIENPDYLISNRVEDLTFGLSEDLNNMQSMGNHVYIPSASFTVTADIRMQYHESKTYAFTMKAMPRDKVDYLSWNDNYR